MTPAVPQPLAWGATWPSLPEFRELAADRRVIPVVRRLLADEVTPVGLYRTLAQGRPGTFILESAEVDGTWARWSFVGVASRATLSVADGQPHWSGDVPVGVPREGDVLDVLAGTLEALRTPLEDGEIFLLDEEEIRVIHTPGHTHGGVCYYSEKSKAVFTGDTVFNVDLGRTDLSDGSEKEMQDSIRNIISLWGNDMIIYPGHGDACTMKYVRKNNKEFKETLK